MQQPRLPKYTARFAVFVPHSQLPSNNVDRAVDIVKAYLYAGAHAEHVERVDDGYLVHVRIDTREDAERFKFVVNYQRDRFASGMYATSDPIFYGPTNL